MQICSLRHNDLTRPVWLLGGVFMLWSTVGVSAPALYDLYFYDDSNQLVGRGNFHLDTTQAVCVEVAARDDCLDEGSSLRKGLYVTSLVDHFVANVHGYDWHLHNPGLTWWTDGQQKPGQQRIYRGSLYGSTPSWCFGDIQGMSASLSFTIATSTLNRGSGRWEQHAIDRDGVPPLYSTGTWVATAVSENVSFPPRSTMTKP